MADYYTRDGQPLSFETWLARLKADPSAHEREKIVCQTTLPNGQWVSTVFLGLNHNYGGGPPLIFETMVFEGRASDLDMDRYSTEAEALAGHEAMCAKWKDVPKGGRLDD